MNHSVEIETLGRAEVRRDGARVEALGRDSLRTAVAVYVATRRVVTRREVQELFWPGRDTKRARKALNQTLYVLRQLLGDAFVASRGRELVRGDGVHLDTDVLESGAGTDDHDVVHAYVGPYLAGWSLPEHPEFILWAERRRVTLERRVREARRRVLADCHRTGDREAALELARRWVRDDPLEDEAQHALIECLFERGDRAGALAQFERYRAAIRAELDVEPLEQTYALVRRIHADPDGSVVNAGVREAGAGTRDDGRVRTLSPRGPARHLVRMRLATTVGLSSMCALVIGGLAYSTADRDDAPSPRRVAVLYFEDVSPDGPVEGLASGLTHELIHRLSRSDGVEVMSRQGVRRFMTEGAPLDSIAETLGVGSVVEGSVQRAGDQVRVHVQLVDPAAGSYLRSTTIERPIDDLLALQDDLARAVDRFLRQRIGAEVGLREARRRAPSAEAWLLAEKVRALGEPFWSAEGRTRVFEAPDGRAILARADSTASALVSAYPDWAEGHRLKGLVALGWEQLVRGGDVDVARAHISAGLTALDVAAGMAPEASETWAALGELRWQSALEYATPAEADDEIRLAERALRQAVALDPGNATAWVSLSQVRQYRGDHEESASFARRALREDAYLSDAAGIRHRLMIAALDGQSPADALDLCEEGHRLHPDDHRFLTCLLTIPGGMGYRVPSSDSAVSLHEWIATRDPMEPDGPTDYRFAFRRMMLAKIHARNGEEALAREEMGRAWALVRDHPRLQPSFEWDAAALSLLLGDTAASLSALERWAAATPELIPYLRESFLFRALHSFPAFRAIVSGEGARQIGTRASRVGPELRDAR